VVYRSWVFRLAEGSWHGSELEYWERTAPAQATIAASRSTKGTAIAWTELSTTTLKILSFEKERE